ncbi:MAG: ABC transporter ATP-binding protein [Spirochaetaceae bacterium]|nr:ABC transporter ATP-binding protein [Spirochaetaceae bacterium]
MLAVNNINKSFNNKPILHNISFEVAALSRVALVGPSGVGKSLLFHLIAGLTAADSGTVRFTLPHQNRHQANLAPSSYLSYMQQKDLLLPHLTAVHNAGLPLILSGYSKQEAHKEVLKHWQAFGLGGHEGYYPHMLSGGQRQRVALLRAVLCRRPLLLMDEPFSALDALTAYELRSFVSEVVKKTQLTLLFITHNIEEALTIADKIVILQGSPAGIAACFKVDSNKKAEQRTAILRALQANSLVINS